MYGNPTGYEVAEHIATKVEINPWIISTLKNTEYIWIRTQGQMSRHQCWDFWEFYLHLSREK